MIQIFKDGSTVAYDSRLEEYNLLDLIVNLGVNKGGAAEFTMPPGHPMYDAFINYKSIVEIYQDGGLLFRGRALYPTDDFVNRRTIMCEGELCFLRDAVVRPYSYLTDPASIFADLISIYNSQVEPAKRFLVGEIAVTDPNDYILLESEYAEQCSDTINKLLERCGGYIVFTSDGDRRVINWYAELDFQSSQTIEFGENLLDFARSASNSNLATAILPYGADLDDGSRVTIESVNGGIDYIQDDEAVDLRGFIIQPIQWDDVADPASLLAKAQQHLATSKQVLTSLTLTAVDLSLVDRTLDQFQIGDNIHVISAPHGVDAWFRLSEMELDLLNPQNSKVTMGSSQTNLTGAAVEGSRGLQSTLNSTIKYATYRSKKTMEAAIQEAVDQLREEIQGVANARYPIGSIYISVESADPAEIFGGTWERVQDTFLLAAGSTYEAGGTGAVGSSGGPSYLAVYMWKRTA